MNQFLHLKTPAMLGERINGWRVCWLGRWDRGRLFYLVMVERALRAVAKSSRYDKWLRLSNLTQHRPFSWRARNRRFPLICTHLHEMIFGDLSAGSPERLVRAEEGIDVSTQYRQLRTASAFEDLAFYRNFSDRISHTDKRCYCHAC